MSNPRLTDFNPLPLKDYSHNPTEEEYDGPDLPFEEQEQSDSENNPSVTDLNSINSSDSAFDVF